MIVLGISCFYHDAAACLVRDGTIVAAAQEERFSRVKNDASFPNNAISYCLEEGRVSIAELDRVVFYDKPFLKFDRLLETYVAFAPRGLRSFLRSMPIWIARKFWTKDLIARELGYHGPILFAEHHESHAASAFFPSPFSHAAILTADGVGEWATTSFGVGSEDGIHLQAEQRFPHSLGLLYSAFTYFCGFKVNSGEHKLMGLAAFGEPRYADTILDELLDLKVDGSFRLNLKYFSFPVGLRMTGRSFSRLFMGRPREPGGPITQREMDLACSIQAVVEEAMLRIAAYVHRVTGEKNLCLAGGVGLNCVANGRLLREGPFENVWIQPASGDAGGALGAALLASFAGKDVKRKNLPEDAMQGSFLGPSFSDEEVGAFLQSEGINFSRLASDKAVVEQTADLLAQGKVVGWFQGRMEFGPRALGHRSILADPRNPGMKDHINESIKFRESFRPFAPSVLEERVTDFFEMTGESPYMLLAAPVRQRSSNGENLGRDSSIAAATHIDGSARVQTVSANRDPLFHYLIQSFESLTGCSALLNTSFNVRGEPVVCTPEQAYRCFQGTGMDVLVMGRCLVQRGSR